MGVRYGKRNRMESIRDLPDEVLASLGTTDINFEKFDEQQIYDKINENLDEVDKRLQES